MNNTVSFNIESAFTCEPNQEVLILVYNDITAGTREFKRALLPYINENNYKIHIIASSYGSYFFLIKRMLQEHQKIKIIFFSHFNDFVNCYNILDIFLSVENFQLPYNQDNFGLILLEDGELDNWGRERKNRRLAELFPGSEYILMHRKINWQHCVDLSYEMLKCEKYGCPGHQILTNKDRANQFTNILLVKMTKTGQLITGEDTLKAFINDRLQFTSVTKHDVQIFQPETLKKFQDYHHHHEAITYEIKFNVIQLLIPPLTKVENISVFASVVETSPKGEQSRINLLYDTYDLQTSNNRSKRQSSDDDLLEPYAVHLLMMKCVPPLSKSDHPFFVRLRNAMLKLLDNLIAEDDKQVFKNTCEQPENNDGVQLHMAQNYIQTRTYLIVNFAELTNKVFLENEKIRMDYHITGAREKLNNHFLKLTLVFCEQVALNLVGKFISNWYTPTEQIEKAVDRLIAKLVQWANNIPLHDETITTWGDFENWVGTDAIMNSGIDVKAASSLFERSQMVSSMRIEFYYLCSELYYAFNRNVTTVAIQQLATSKLERVDAVVAVLDRSFMAGIRNLHQSIDREQWALMRPQIFYFLVRIQQEHKLFDDFLLVVRRMFDIHYIDMPMAPYEKLQEVKGEFDVYQNQTGKYINGAIDTTRQWGRKFRVTTDYIIANTGAPQKSVINDAAKWFTDLFRDEQSVTRTGYDFGGTLVLVSLIVRKFFKGRRNFF